MQIITRAWPTIVLAADAILTLVVLAVLACALIVAGNAAFLGLLGTDVPWTALVFGVAYLVASAQLIAVVGESLAQRWGR